MPHNHSLFNGNMEKNAAFFLLRRYAGWAGAVVCHGAGAAVDRWPEQSVLSAQFRERLPTKSCKNIIQNTFGLKQHMDLNRSLLSNLSFSLRSSSCDYQERDYDTFQKEKELILCFSYYKRDLKINGRAHTCKYNVLKIRHTEENRSIV